jgi:hypothetical protein
MSNGRRFELGRSVVHFIFGAGLGALVGWGVATRFEYSVWLGAPWRLAATESAGDLREVGAMLTPEVKATLVLQDWNVSGRCTPNGWPHSRRSLPRSAPTAPTSSRPGSPTLRPRAPTRGPFSLVGAERQRAGDDAARANVGDRRANGSVW